MTRSSSLSDIKLYNGKIILERFGVSPVINAHTVEEFIYFYTSSFIDEVYKRECTCHI